MLRFNFIFLFMLVSCSIIPNKEFNVTRTNNHRDSKIKKLEFVSRFPNEKYSTLYSTEEIEKAPGYVNDFSLPSSFKDCEIDIYHEVFHYQTSFYVNVMEGLTIGTLGIVPYRVDLMFKTKIKLSNGVKVIEKETVSEKMSYRLGLIYVPMFIGGIFDKDVKLTNKITARMYSYQISKLADELKDFKCN